MPKNQMKSKKPSQRNRSNGIAPAVTMWFHSNIQSNVNGVPVKRFDVAPVLAGFNAALDTAKDY